MKINKSDSLIEEIQQQLKDRVLKQAAESLLLDTNWWWHEVIEHIQLELLNQILKDKEFIIRVKEALLHRIQTNVHDEYYYKDVRENLLIEAFNKALHGRIYTDDPEEQVTLNAVALKEWFYWIHDFKWLYHRVINLLSSNKISEEWKNL